MLRIARRTMKPRCRHPSRRTQVRTPQDEETKKPGRFSRPGVQSKRWSRGSFRSAADFDVAEAPAVAVPEAFANQVAGRGRVFHIERATVGRAAGRERAT